MIDTHDSTLYEMRSFNAVLRTQVQNRQASGLACCCLHCMASFQVLMSVGGVCFCLRLTGNDETQVIQLGRQKEGPAQAIGSSTLRQAQQQRGKTL